MEKIYLGAGCFWGVEELLRRKEGIIQATSGYCGGELENPTYQDICTGTTGHAEVVEVLFNLQKISIIELLKYFFQLHDATQLNRQGNDIGTQYRSVIYTNLLEEIVLVKKSMKKFQFILNNNKLGKIRTEIDILENFFMAEEYHQKYLHKNPNGYCGLQGLNLEYT